MRKQHTVAQSGASGCVNAGPQRLTDAIVISTLSLAISLLLARIWRWFDQGPRQPGR